MLHPMPSPSDALRSIAQGRRRDPLAPVTIVAPTRVAALHLRRRLAIDHGAIAGVRVEVLPRLAELLAAAVLAQRFDGPLARPIGDYLAAQLAREAGRGLDDVRELPGFARVLRQSFARLRRGGFARSEALKPSLGSDLLGEVIRLYAEFRQRSERFYDDEDLYEAAAAEVTRRGAGAIAELGDIYVLPPGPLTAGADGLLRALRRVAGASRFHVLDEAESAPETSFILAPDPGTEAREVAREVLQALQSGAGLHEMAVFHGADASYRALLAQAFETARIPATPMPGTPLGETAAGRGVLAMAELPLKQYSRTAVFDWLSLAPMKPHFSGRATAWRRIAADAGITRSGVLWASRLQAVIANEQQHAAADEDRREAAERRAGAATELRDFAMGLIADLEPLRARMRAAAFIEAFKGVVEKYLDVVSPAMPQVLEQIEQLGTIDKLEGAGFTLDSFVAALRANLDAAFHRQARLGDGVLIADYRQAAGLSFRQVVLAGTYEGVFPVGAPQEALVEDRYWTELQRANHPFLEDAALRSQRARDAALRALNAATGHLTWTAPLQAAGAGREHYPSQFMLEAARSRDVAISSATELRRASASAWLRRPPSPLAAMLQGPALDVSEARLRAAVIGRQHGSGVATDHPLQPAMRLLGRRHSQAFSEYDGNLGALAGEELVPSGSVSPTSLEHYATCGMRYYLNAVLRLRPPEEPEDRDTIDPRDRGTLVHEVLDRFFRSRLDAGRPDVGEPWNDDDRAHLLDLLEEQLEDARGRGRTGLDVFAEHERRRLRADLLTFLDKDTDFRLDSGSQPVAFEYRIPAVPFDDLMLRGVADRIDRTPDGRRAWVIDYKTGRPDSYDKVGSAEDPVVGGTRLQLPVYLTAVEDAQEAKAVYWFVSSAGGYAQREFANTPENLERYRKTMRSILAGVRAGSFPAVPGEEDTRPGYSFKNCSYCEFDRLCSVRRDDELQAKGADPALRPWSSVAPTARGEQ